MNDSHKLLDVYIPESPNHPGLYANEHEFIVGKISNGKEISTQNPLMARKFDTLEDCQRWCNDNPAPRFVPMAHQFMI